MGVETSPPYLTMKIKVVQDYVSPWKGFKGGTVAEVSGDLGRWLLQHHPEHFKEVSKPPVDKAVKSPPRSKGRRSRTK